MRERKKRDFFHEITLKFSLPGGMITTVKNLFLGEPNAHFLENC